ncbi:lactonase family protein [Alloacidobacterium dinghuense]|nr:beta-propeller fold lactonase family protein [Alloacidobacterium dinghuense]
MHKRMQSISMLLVLATAILPMYASADANDVDSAHAVFVMSNAADRNEVIAFARATDGSLQETHRFPTGGRGSGGNHDPLESQGSLTLSQDHSLLFAVNAGSGEVSVFRVHGSTLVLSDKVLSEGSEPNAIAHHGNLVYVVNTGGSSNVAGFLLEGDHLRYIKNSLTFLSTNTSGAASIAFSPDGQFLAVTERLTNNIDVFRVLADGKLSPIVTNPSAGPGVFAVSFAPEGVAIVSETGPANVTNGSAVSSYAILPNGTLSAISTSVPTLGAANCWNAVTPDGRFVYVSNAGSSTISGFAISATGVLSALPGTVVGENPNGAGNLDIAVSADGKFLYTLNSSNGTVGIFAIQKDGTLSNVGSSTGIGQDTGFNGIAAN